MWKKHIAKLLVFAMVLSLLPFTAAAVDANVGSYITLGDNPNINVNDTVYKLTRGGGDGTTSDKAVQLSPENGAKIPKNNVSISFSVAVTSNNELCGVYDVSKDANADLTKATRKDVNGTVTDSYSISSDTGTESVLYCVATKPTQSDGQQDTVNKTYIRVEMPVGAVDPAVVSVQSTVDTVSATLNDEKTGITLSGSLAAPESDTSGEVGLTVTYTDEKLAEKTANVTINLTYTPEAGETTASWAIDTTEVTVVTGLSLTVGGTVNVSTGEPATPAIVSVESKVDTVSATLNAEKTGITLSGSLAAPESDTNGEVGLTVTYSDENLANQTVDVTISLTYTPAADETAASWAIDTTEVTVVSGLNLTVGGTVNVSTGEPATPAIVSVESKVDTVSATLNAEKTGVTLSGSLAAPESDTSGEVGLTVTYSDENLANQTVDVTISLTYTPAAGETAASWAIDTTEVTVVSGLNLTVGGIVSVKSGGSDNPDNPDNPGETVYSISLDVTTKDLTIDSKNAAAASAVLTATVEPADAKVKWESSNSKIVEVTPNGKTATIKAIASSTETVTITASVLNADDEVAKSADCKVTVKTATDETVPVKSVTVEPDTLPMTVGQEETLKATVDPANATDNTVTWTSSDKEIATVDPTTGKVTAVKAGKTTITATAGGVSGTCEVTVSDVEVEKPAVDVAEKPDESAVSSVTSAEAKKTVEEAHEALKTGTEVTGLDNAIVAEKNDKGDVTIAGQTIDKAQIDEAMEAFKEQHSNVNENDIRTVVVPKVEIKIARASEASNGNVTSLTFDIKAFAEIWITAENESKNIDSENSVRTTDRIDLEKTEEAITIVLPMPTAFQTLKTPFVKHRKGNDLFWHRGSLNGGKLSFVNKRGFSEFTVEDAGDGKAVIGENSYYNSLQDAINAAKNNDVITVLDNGQSATVSKAITFKMVNAEEVTGATINAGSGYEKSEKNGVYTFTAESKEPSNTGSTGGGGGGGSSKPAIKPGADTDRPTTPTTTPGGGVAGFNDVATSAWYADSVKYVVDKGLFGGVGNGNFAPNANMTRAMMWTVLARYMGVNTNSGSNWYEAARTWAMAQNISDGTMADGNVTREQFVTMLWRLSGQPAVGTSASFTDNGRISGYAKTAVDWAVAQGILNGYNDGSFRPQGSATRAEVAKMLTVFCQNADNAEPTETETESEA